MRKTWRSLTITGDEDIGSTLPSSRRMKPVHPGEILRVEFLEPMNLSAIAVAHACGVPRTRIERLVSEKTSVSADTALRLARYFGTSAQFWLNLQAGFDLRTAEKQSRRSLAKIQPLRQDAAE